MDIITFRAYINDILKNEPPHIVAESKRVIQLTLDLLDQETISHEGIAIIVALVKKDSSAT